MLVIVPTRGRPENIARLEQALEDTDTTVADFLYVIDHDDPRRLDYLKLGLRRIMVVPQRLRLGRTLNHASELYQEAYSAIGFMGDDHCPRTPEWDRMLADSLALEGPRIVYGNDLLQGANLPTAVFMHSKIIKTLGYMCPLTMTHLYLDNFWKELGEAVGGLVYRPDVIIEHLHPAAAKAPMDAGYREANSTEQDTADRNAWLAYRVQSMTYAADRVLGAYR